MGSNHVKHVFMAIFFFAVILGHLVLGIAPDIDCKVVNDIEETDPVNRIIKPFFYEVKKCKGGTGLRKGYQCQMTEKEAKILEVFNIHKFKSSTLIIESAISCKEVCVCGKDCANPRPAVCERGFSWDSSKCRCVCNSNGIFGSRKGGERTGIEVRYFVISISALFVLFSIASIIIIAVCYFRFKKRMEKYRFLRTVEWNKEQEQKLEKYFSYVDGAAKDELMKKRSKKICCFSFLSKRKQENLLLRQENGGDQVDAAIVHDQAKDFTAQECFDIGYIAFKRNKYDKMLLWMQKAEEKWQQNGAPQSNSNDFQYDLYSYLSIAFLADKSWNIQKAHEYKEKAVQLKKRAQGGRVSLDETGFQTTAEDLNSNQ